MARGNAAPSLQGKAEGCAGEGRAGVLPACQIVVLPVTLVIGSRIGWDFLLTPGWQAGFLLF